MDPVTMLSGIILACLAFSAFFSAAETALTAVNRATMFARMQEGNRRAALVVRLCERKESLISTILLGNNIVNITAASVGTVLAIHLYGSEYGPLVATLVLTVVVLIFGEVLPKTLAIKHPDRTAMLLAPMLHIILQFLHPLNWLLQKALRLIFWLLRINHAGGQVGDANELLRGTIELHHHEGEMEREDRDMLGSILDLGERSVSEVMTHRSKVESIDIALEPETIISAMIASSHSRLPLWKDNAENIIGVLHQKDLFRLMRQQKIGITREMIRRIAQKPWFVPETTSLDDQLTAFRSKRKHFACVVDEYGAFLGIVTLEDIIEEIVGEIDDEHDLLAMAEINPFGDSAYRVAGTVTIRDLNRQLDWDLPDENATTIAGLVLHEARVIPDKGAMFEFFGYRFTVAEKRANQITQIIIEKLVDAFDDAQE